MANKLETALSRVGTVAKKVCSFLFGKALPMATQLAVHAEPLIDILAPSIGAEFTLVTNSAFRVEQAAAVLPAGMSSQQKFAAVFGAVKNDLLPTLTSQGLSDAEANATLSKYVESVVTVWNTFPAAPPPVAQQTHTGTADQPAPQLSTTSTSGAVPIVH